MSVEKMTRIIGVCSGKGGVGKTTVVTNLAFALRNLGKKVLIIDCNLSTPHLAYYIGATNYNYTLNDALRNKVDIISTVHTHDMIRYIPASLKIEDLIGIDPVTFKKHLKKLVSGKIDFIFLDSAPGLGREAISVLDAADEIILVTLPFAPMINDVIRCADVLKSVKGTKSLGIVLNMTTNSTHEIVSKNVEKLTGLPVIGEIPFDKNIVYGLVLKSPVVNYKPNSIASICFIQLASYLIGKEYKLPVRIKIHKLFTKAKNYILPQKISLSQSIEDIKEDILIQRE